MLAFLAAALVLTAACLVNAASYESTTPPDWLVYSYPTTDVVVNNTVTLGINGGALHIPRVFYGLGYNLSVSTTLPNNTNILRMAISNLDDGVDGWVQCTGTGSSQRDSSLLNSVTFAVNAVGRHTAFWNVTYGTSDDQKVVNRTSCDPPRMSYQTWLFNATFNVVEATTNSNLSPVYTTVTSDFPSEPTGKFFESNTASSLAPNLLALGLATLALVSRVV